MVLPDSHGISRAPCYLGYCPEVAKISPTGVSPSVPTVSTRLRLSTRFLTSCRISSSGWAVPLPRLRNACWLLHVTGLACSPFAHHYSGNRGCFLFLWVLRCFTSPRFLHLPYVFRQGRRAITPAQVSLFGDPRVDVWLPTNRGLSQAPTSFFGSWCQGIHRVPLSTWQLQMMLASTMQFSRYGRSRPAPLLQRRGTGPGRGAALMPCGMASVPSGPNSVLGPLAPGSAFRADLTGRRPYLRSRR